MHSFSLGGIWMFPKESRFVIYPLLVNNLCNGFPIGSMSRLNSTVIIPNHPSVMENLDVVHEYLHTERHLNWMSGPFTHDETEQIL